jgi:hypothetical protein
MNVRPVFVALIFSCWIYLFCGYHHPAPRPTTPGFDNGALVLMPFVPMHVSLAPHVLHSLIVSFPIFQLPSS